MDSITVVKIGGKVLNQPSMLEVFLDQFHQLTGPKLLVHGGGVLATALAQRMGVDVQMIDGRRITDEQMRDIVVMMYGGLVNKTVVAQLQAKGCSSIGLTGADANTIVSTKRPPVNGLDYGWVGDPREVGHAFLHTLLVANHVPVIAPLTHDGKGNLLNTNADTMARYLASSLVSYGSVSLLYAFELQGVLRDINQPTSLIKSLDQSGYDEARSNQWISEGMIPKLDNAFEAKKAGVQEVSLVRYDQLVSLQQGDFDEYTRLQ